MTRITKEALEATAYHEAGHAVAAWHLQFPLRSVTVVPGSGCSGLTALKKTPVDYNWQLERTDRGRLKAERYVIYCLAGMAAQRRFRPNSCRGWHSWQDYLDAVDAMEHFCNSDEELQAYMKLLHIRTEGLFETPATWNRVCVVAGELIKHKTLSRKQVVTLIQQVLSTARPPNTVGKPA